jgi:hypothetical protein
VRWRRREADLGLGCAARLRVKSLDRSSVSGGGDSPSGKCGEGFVLSRPVRVEAKKVSSDPEHDG